MIKIEYVSNDNDRLEEHYTIVTNDEEVTLNEIMLGFVKTCIAAGYNMGSFDNIVKEAAEEIEDGYNFQDYLSDVTFGY